MYQFEIHSSLFGKKITALVLVLPQGMHVSLYGGDLPHIGAVSIAGPDGLVHTEQFPGHREGVVSDAWAKKLTAAGYAPVVVEAGIHYDGLSREGITQVLQLTEEMLERVLGNLVSGHRTVCPEWADSLTGVREVIVSNQPCPVPLFLRVPFGR